MNNSKKFKDYYKDPAFRARHLSYIKTQVVCECGCKTMRCNMYRHKQSRKHIEYMVKQMKNIEKLRGELEELKAEVKKLKGK